MRGRYLILTFAIAILVVIPQTVSADGNSDSDQISALSVLRRAESRRLAGSP